MKHKHRIKPGYEGGDYSEENVVVLSVTQHAMWHFAEWQRKGRLEDRVAWRGLIGIIGHEEAVAEALAIGGKNARESLIGRKLTEEHKKNIGKGVQGLKRTEEDKAKKSIAAHKRWAKPEARDFVKAKHKDWEERLAPYDLTSVEQRKQAALDLGFTYHWISKKAKHILKIHKQPPEA